MPFLAVGLSPNQSVANELLGQMAYQDNADVQSDFIPVVTIDQLRNRRNYPAFAVLISNNNQRGIFYRDVSDTTTPDDGQDFLVTTDGVRYRRALVARRYTPTSSLDTGLPAVGSYCYDNTRFYVRTSATEIKFITFSGTL